MERIARGLITPCKQEEIKMKNKQLDKKQEEKLLKYFSEKIKKHFDNLTRSILKELYGDENYDIFKD